MNLNQPQRTTPTLARIAPGTVYRHPRGEAIYMKLAPQENNQRFNCVDLAKGFLYYTCPTSAVIPLACVLEEDKDEDR